MARETGLEPATSGVTGRRSNQLSYSRSIGRALRLGRAGSAVNPVSLADRCLGLRRAFGSVVGGDGFEPPTLSV
jgi:hypothetical protein